MTREDLLPAAAFAVAGLAGAGFATGYALDAGTPLLGALVAVAFAGLAVGLGAWSQRFMPTGTVQERRHRPEEAAGGVEPLLGRERTVGRRRLLGGLLAGSGAVVGLALLAPLRSLGSRPDRESLYGTPWRRGLRLVDREGNPVHLDDLAVGAMTTVFAEGGAERSRSQTVLVRLPEGREVLGEGNQDWVVEGYVAFSRLCTHMGCPVGIYEQQANLLVCPCHQSAFDVLRGAEPVYGPAARALPQLPLGVDDEGFLVALGDFAGVVGPGFWRRP